MNVLIVVPYAINTPHYETELEVAQNHIKEGDFIRMLYCIATELVASFEDKPVLFRQFLAARILPVLGKPAHIERPQFLARRAVRPVSLAHDVINQIAFVIDEHLLRSNRPGCITRHDVVVVKFHDLSRTA